MNRRFHLPGVLGCWLLAFGLSLATAHAALLPWSALQGKPVLFVTGDTPAGAPNDDALVR